MTMQSVLVSLGHPGLHSLCQSASVTLDYTVCWSASVTQSVLVSLSHPGLHSLHRSASITQDYTIFAGQPRSPMTTQSMLVSLNHPVGAGQPQPPRTTQSAQASVSKNCHVTLLRRPRHDCIYFHRAGTQTAQ